MEINKEQSVKFKIVSSLSMIGVIFIHAKFIMSRWGETLNKDSFWSVISNAIQYLVSEQITRVCVPVFFLISGFFFFQKFNGTVVTFISLLKKRKSSILIPYLFWSLFWFFIYQIYNNTLHQNFIIQLYNALIYPVPYQFWFLQILIICFLSSPLIHFFIKKFGVVFLIILLLIYFLDYNTFKADIHGMLFYSLGAYLANQKSIRRKIFNTKINFLFYFVLIFIAEILFLINSGNHSVFWILIHKFSIIFGLIILVNYIFFHKLSYNKFTKFVISLHSGFFFFLFVVHEPLLSFLKRIWLLLIGESFNLIAFFMLPVFLIITIYFIYIFMFRTCNTFLRLISGGR